jgi:hypothetical protein
MAIGQQDGQGQLENKGRCRRLRLRIHFGGWKVDHCRCCQVLQFEMVDERSVVVEDADGRGIAKVVKDGLTQAGSLKLTRSAVEWPWAVHVTCRLQLIPHDRLVAKTCDKYKD